MDPFLVTILALLSFAAGAIYGAWRHREATLERACDRFLSTTDEVMDYLRLRGPWLCEKCKEPRT